MKICDLIDYKENGIKLKSNNIEGREILEEIINIDFDGLFRLIDVKTNLDETKMKINFYKLDLNKSETKSITVIDNTEELYIAVKKVEKISKKTTTTTNYIIVKDDYSFVAEKKEIVDGTTNIKLINKEEYRSEGNKLKVIRMED